MQLGEGYGDAVTREEKDEGTGQLLGSVGASLTRWCRRLEISKNPCRGVCFEQRVRQFWLLGPKMQQCCVFGSCWPGECWASKGGGCKKPQRWGAVRLRWGAGGPIRRGRDPAKREAPKDCWGMPKGSSILRGRDLKGTGQSTCKPVSNLTQLQTRGGTRGNSRDLT